MTLQSKSGYRTRTPNFHSLKSKFNTDGFTLIELLVVLIIAGAGVSLVAPSLIGALEGIRAQAEEKKLADVVEAVRMRAFFRQVPYVIEFNENVLTVRNEKVRIEFEFIDFAQTTLTFNGNGFADSDALKYKLKGAEKALNVSS